LVSVIQPRILNREELAVIIPNSKSVRIRIELLLKLLIFVCEVPFLGSNTEGKVGQVERNGY
jgi:hypothetical protein